MDGLSEFHPDRMASRILGMGDILSIVEKVSNEIDEKDAEDLAKKMAKGKSVSYTHLRAHETDSYLVCRLLLEKKKQKHTNKKKKMKMITRNVKLISKTNNIFNSMNAHELSEL